MAVKARWKGQLDSEGRPVEFHSGIPSRDLTDEDWEVMSKDEQDTVLASKLFDVVGTPDTSEAERERHRSRLENRAAREAEKGEES